MKYQELPWEQLTTGQLEQNMYINLIIAREFTLSLNIALALYPDSENLKEMSAEELDTDNLSFLDFTHKADHWEFLDFFFKKSGIIVHEKIKEVTDEYISIMHSLPDEVKAMTVFSQEKSSDEFFKKLLKAPGWNDSTHLKAYKYFLERHAELDSRPGGHADAVSEFEIDHEKLSDIYKAYSDMAKVLFEI